jgi:hypothetical protein
MNDDLETMRLRKIDQWKRKKDTVRPLGELIQRMIQTVRPVQQAALTLQQAWGQLLPEALTQHSRVHQLRGGRLTVAVDSAAHLQELSMLVRGGLVEQLRQMCPNARLQEIRLVRGSAKRPAGSGH